MPIQKTRSRRGRRPLVWVFGLSLASLPMGKTGWTQTPNDDVVYWPRNDFVIPFQIDTNGQLPREVVLEVSEDGGQSWQICSRSDTRTRQFQYVASNDGLYQFRLKTVDAEGRRFNNPGEPLKIHVDTRKPEAKLVVDIDPRGTMQAEFLIVDEAIQKDSVLLEYQTETNALWNKIPFELNEGTTTGEWTGFGRWVLPSQARQLVVRLVAKDRAGNMVEVTRLPQLPKTASQIRDVRTASQPRSSATGNPSTRPELADRDTSSSRTLSFPEDKPIGSGVANSELPRVEILGRPNVQPPSLDPSISTQQKLLQQQQELIEQRQRLIDQQQKLFDQQRQAIESHPELRPMNSSPWDNRSIPADGTPLETYEQGVPERSPFSQKPAIPTERTIPRSSNLPVRELSQDEIEAIRRGDRSGSVAGANSKQDFRQDNALELGDPAALSPTNRNVPSSRFEVERNSSLASSTQTPSSLIASKSTNSFMDGGNRNAQPFSSTPIPNLGPDASRTTSGPMPRGIQPLFSNSKTFSLDYQIEKSPGAPVVDVELWGTDDQGTTWTLWGKDPDRRSPFDIQVDEDGLFGFRMVIVGANGLASNRPRNGDLADTWIQVDTVRPVVKIQSALYGNGNETGSLVIEYVAKDEFLGERPISLYYSETVDGPWNLISRGMKNSGRHLWPADASLPPTIFLKIEGIDIAGNIATSVLDVPVQVEGIAPRGRFQGFRTIPQ